MWCEDEAGPYQAIPQPGQGWAPAGEPAHYPHEYVRGGTAKLLTLFHPGTGRVRVQGVTQAPNAVLHPWLKTALAAVVEALPPVDPAVLDQAPAERRAAWTAWQEGLSIRFTLPQALPPLRLLLILDNLAGHKTPEFVCWLMNHGILPLYTPLGGSWLNMAESVQRILVRRALAGQHPESPAQINGLAGGRCEGLECFSHAVHLGRQACRPAATPTGTPPRPRRFRCRDGL